MNVLFKNRIYPLSFQQRGGPKRVDFSELDSSKTNARPLTTKDIISLGNRIPDYPIEAIRNKISGIVKVSIEIDDAGKVKDSKIGSTSGARILDLSALEASKDWRFPKEYYSKNFDVDIEYILKD
jgi:TonB family protein